MIELDEDLIPGYHCVKCGGGCCKDDVFKRIKGMDVICLECGGM